jgi:hypothetical protein
MLIARQRVTKHNFAKIEEVVFPMVPTGDYISIPVVNRKPVVERE